jgi:hypothetical protein
MASNQEGIMAFEGGCFCGKVRYKGAEEHGGGHCHCTACRRTSGTGHCSHMIVPEAGFTVSGEVRFHDAPADSGNNVSRGFCPTCGSAIYSTNSGMPGVVFVRASSLDDPEVFKPQMVVYTDRAATWDHMDVALPSFAAMPEPDAMPERLVAGDG